MIAVLKAVEKLHDPFGSSRTVHKRRRFQNVPLRADMTFLALPKHVRLAQLKHMRVRSQLLTLMGLQKKPPNLLHCEELPSRFLSDERHNSEGACTGAITGCESLFFRYSQGSN